MPNRTVVLSTPVRTAIGTFGGSLKGTPATALGATAIRAVLARTKLDHAKVETVVMGNVVQAGNKMNPARQAAIIGGLPVEAPAHDREPRVRLRRTGDRFGRPGDHARHGRLRDRRRHGEHGHSPLPDGRWALGVSHGRRADLRQHAEGWPKRRLLRSAFGVAYRGPGQSPSDHTRGPGPLGGTVAEAFLGGAGCGQVHGGDRAGRVVRAEQAGTCSRRTSTTAPRRRSRASPSCAPPSARMARSPPAMRPGSTAAPRR